jgi:predicted  nucleic acid-binding Zn-ribbon protein
MMSPAKQLLELQQYDTEAQQRQQALAAVLTRLGDSSALDSATARVERAAKLAQEARASQRDAELALQQLTARIKDVERRLYSGGSTNPKELVSLQQDMDMLKRQQTAQEGRLLELIAKAEDAEKEADAARRVVREVEDAWQRTNAELLGERDRLQAALAAAQQHAARARNVVAPQELALYDALRKARGGVAVARVSNGICRGCGVSVPTRDAQRARSGQELVRCTSCGRILAAA